MANRRLSIQIFVYHGDADQSAIVEYSRIRVRRLCSVKNRVIAQNENRVILNRQNEVSRCRRGMKARSESAGSGLEELRPPGFFTRSLKVCPQHSHWKKLRRRAPIRPHDSGIRH